MVEIRVNFEVSQQVECYSGQAYAERLQAFWWQGRRLEVVNVIESRRTPEGLFFRVFAGESGYFELIYNQEQDDWLIRQS